MAFMFAAALLLAACGAEVDGVAAESAEVLDDVLTDEDAAEDAQGSEDAATGTEDATEEPAPSATEEDTSVEDEDASAGDEGAGTEDEAAGSEDAAREGAGSEGANDSSDTSSPSGPTTHRASSGAQQECEAVETADPGAFFVFPDDDDPSTYEAGTSPVTVEFLGCGNTFEANVQYEAYHGHDSTPTLEGFTMGGTLGDWREFRFEETFWTPGEWTVIVFEIDAKHGDRRLYDEVTFKVDPR